jgi:hypothetical protein
MDVEQIVAGGFQYLFSLRTSGKAQGFHTFNSKRFNNGFHREEASLGF